MTDAQFLEWLERGGARVALVEVDTSTPRYISTFPYSTLPTDTPANVMYLPVLASSFAFTERMSLDGSINLSVGTLELHNEDGILDSWLDEVWVNRTISVRVGDVSWPRSDFRVVFSGVIAELAANGPTRLSIVLRNKLERLNTPATETVLGGTTANKDRLLPVTLGECHNVTPLLVNPAEHEYRWHTGAAERLIDVRDEGVPVAATPNLAAGTFKLVKSPKGAITASVQGATPYSPTVAVLMHQLGFLQGL